MNQTSYDEWDDDLDEVFEQCILKEAEYLSQNPSAQRKPLKNVALENEPRTSNWVNGNCNSFIREKRSSEVTFTNKVKGEGINIKEKISSTNVNVTLKKSSTSLSRKSSFYKPLDIETSPSKSQRNGSSVSPEVSTGQGNSKNAGSLVHLQRQLDQVLKEKAKIEEESLLRQGEVFNLRCELKRKDNNAETLRVDQCIALEAAEKRGKEKALKRVTELESKIKSLESETDKLQGSLLFKNREIEELIKKCKLLENQHAISSQKETKHLCSSPSPKKRKLETSKSFNTFTDRFDFGGLKKTLKHAEIQTESETQFRTRFRLKVASVRGQASGSRRAYCLLSSFEKNTVETAAENITKENESLLIGELINNDSNFSDSENHIVKYVFKNLETLLENNDVEEVSGRSAGNAKRIGENFMYSGVDLIHLIQYLSIIHAGNDHTAQKGVNIVCKLLNKLLKQSNPNLEASYEALESLSCLVRQCITFPADLCNTAIESLLRISQIPNNIFLHKLLQALNSLSRFNVFKKKICTNEVGNCLLSKICNWVGKNRSRLPSRETDSLFISFVSHLLEDSNPVFLNNYCSCSSSLLLTVVNYLCRISSESSLEDSHWHSVMNGLRVLHLWQLKDSSWWEKVSQFYSYPILLSTVVRKSKYLKSKGILNSVTWDHLYDLYEIDETVLS